MSSKTSPYPSTHRSLAEKVRALATDKWFAASLVVMAFASLQVSYAVGQEKSRSQILAHIGQNPVTMADIDFQLGRSTAGSDVLQELPPAILNSTVEMIGLQRQALATLRNSKQAVSDAAVDRWLEANPPSVQDPSLELKAAQIIKAVSERTGVSETNYRDFIAFRLSWPAYLKKHLTESNVGKHFRNQAARFDGTQFEMEMASLAVPAGESNVRSAANEKLKEIRERMQDEGIALSEAASETKDVELRERAWIQGTGDLDPSIIDAVLLMDDDGISEPIHTATGVHLVQLHATKPGDRELNAVRGDVRAHMLLFLLKHLASKSQNEMPLVSAM